MRLQPRAQPDSDSPYIAASSFPPICILDASNRASVCTAKWPRSIRSIEFKFVWISTLSGGMGAVKATRKTYSGLASAFDADFAEAQHDLASGHRPAEIKFRAEARENENLVDLPPHFRRGWPEKNRISRHLAFSVQRRLHDQDASL